MKYRVKNFYKFQHFHDRKPPWIKVYRDLLDDISWFRISPLSSKTLVNLWLLSSEAYGNLPSEPEIAFRLRLSREELTSVLKELLEFNFIENGEYPLDGDSDMPINERIRKTNGYGSRYISNETKMLVLQRDDHKCQHCGSNEKLEFDHIVPVSGGGNSEADNLQLLCRSCNRSKRAKPYHEFATLSAEKTSSLRSPETEIESEKKKEKPFIRFVEFWDAYPKSPRKVAKTAAQKKWQSKNYDEIADKIISHVNMMKNSDQWKKERGQYIPMPMTYLNRESWDIDMTPTKNPWDNAK